ncbi:MAG TPA: DUF1156 domain-containing protein [Bryobacteraceae bacterium]|nr:DUF1156 domain-containing protein [Bryobacteraceae bacterium]
MTDQPRLIEVAFPLKQASVASVHEKNVRHGHISTLHIWPARRPLAACRAALLATLLPDPGDPEKRKALLDKIGGKIVTKPVEDVDDEGNTVIEDKEVVESGVLAWGQEDEAALSELREEIKQFYNGRLPSVLDPFAGGGAIPLEAMRLGCSVTASDINPVAWLILRATLEYPHKFSGKRWPLPDFVRDWPDFIEDFLAGKVKKRKRGQKTHFSDPQQLKLTELPPADLAWHVRAWGLWVLERARADLARYFPVVEDEPTVVYLWSRTARDVVTGGRIPLLKTFWLTRKRGRRAALLPIPNGDRVDFAFLREEDISNPSRVTREYPHLEKWGVREENFIDFLNDGSMNRAGVWSPISGRPRTIALTMDDLKRQGKQGLLGCQLVGVVTEALQPNGKRTFKRYRLPNSGEVAAAKVDLPTDPDGETPYGLPNEALPAEGALGIRVVLYGFKKWGDLLTSRQLLTAKEFLKHSRAAMELIKGSDESLAEAVGAFLGCTLDRLIDYNSQQCNWDPRGEYITHTFHRFALPMKWDFCELNPFSGCTGDYSGALTWVQHYISHALKAAQGQPTPVISNVSALHMNGSKFANIITDPPYYGAIPYSDLMDYFYIWLRRLYAGLLPAVDAHFSNELGPKWNHTTNDGELVDDASRFGGDAGKSKQNYEEGMAKAFLQCLDLLEDGGRFVVVFANKDVEAWETLISALIRSGATVSASWPIQTEMPNRTRGMSSAALSTSVWLVCRKRPKTASAGWEEAVLDRMRQILFDSRDTLGGRNILQYYFDLGIQGPDFIWAALGPALEAYSAHLFVKKTGGGMMTVSQFLHEVRKLVLQFSLGELPGFHDLQKETQGRGESLEIDPVTQYYLLHRAYFRLDPAPAGACILYANACGKNETELKVVWNILAQGGKKKGRPRKEEEEDLDDGQETAAEGKGSEYRLIKWEERAGADGLGEGKAGHPAPLIDKLHRLMYLFQQNRTMEVQQLFDSWGLANERAFKPLLQAVRELALRDGQEAERRIVEALATQLKMNRKVVIVANEAKEVSLFESIEDLGHVPVS